MIQISTDEVYGSLSNDTAVEESKLNPSNPYAATKASAELLIKSYITTFGSDVIITRCTNNFGPRQFIEKLIPKTIILANQNKKIPIYGNGKNIRDWIYVDDHCEALIKVLKKGKKGEFYNIGSNINLNNIEISNSLLKIAKKTINVGNKVKIKFVKDRPGHDIRYALNSNKIKKKIGWKPKTKFVEGIKNTFIWYLDNLEYYKNISKKNIINRLGNKID